VPEPRALTYAELGATAGILPPGYRHLRRSAVLGPGDELFQRASEAVLDWQIQERSGIRVEGGHRPLSVGDEVRLRIGVGRWRLVAPARVVRIIDEPDARGFAYGTLPGHPERGEESFVVRRRADGAIQLEIVAFSRPARWYSRLGAPLTRLAQRWMTGRYLVALRRT